MLRPVQSLSLRGHEVGPWLVTAEGLVVGFTAGDFAFLEGEPPRTRLHLYRRDPRLGRRWELALEGRWHPRFAMEGHVIVADCDGNGVAAVSLAEGRLVWSAASAGGCVWRLGRSLVLVDRDVPEARFVRPADGHPVGRQALPNPHVRGVVEDVLVLHGRTGALGGRRQRRNSGRRPPSRVTALDLESGKTLWDEETGVNGEWPAGSEEELEWLTRSSWTSLDPPGDLPAVLVVVRAVSNQKWRVRGLAPRTREEKWAVDVDSRPCHWVPETGIAPVFDAAQVGSLDLASGAARPLFSGFPPVRGRRCHDGWDHCLGQQGRHLVFQNAQRCIDLLDLDNGEYLHRPLATAEELSDAGELDGFLVLRGKRLDLYDAAEATSRSGEG